MSVTALWLLIKIWLFFAAVHRDVGLPQKTKLLIPGEEKNAHPVGSGIAVFEQSTIE